MQVGHELRTLFGPLLQADEGVADQVGGGFMSCVEQEHAVLQQLHFGQRFATIALDEAGQDVVLRIAGVLAALCNQLLEVVEKFVDAAMPQGFLFGRECGFECAQNGQRPAAQWASVGMRYVQQVADDLHRNRAGKVFNQVAAALGLHGVQQLVHQTYQPRRHAFDGAAREGAHDDAAHTGVQRRVVEHQRAGVVLEQWRDAGCYRPGCLIVGRVVVLGSKFHLLVRAEQLRVAVDRHQVGMAGQEERTVGHALDRIGLAQPGIDRIGVGQKIGRQLAQVQMGCNFCGPGSGHGGRDGVHALRKSLRACSTPSGSSVMSE